MIPITTVGCIWVEGVDERDFRKTGLARSIDILQASGFGPQFVVWREAGKREKSAFYRRAAESLDKIISISEAFHIFSTGVDGKRDFHRPFSYLILDRSYSQNRFLLYCDKYHMTSLTAIETIFGDRFDCAYAYEDEVLDAPPAYFAGVDFVGELGETFKPPFKRADRIEHWRSNLWRGIDSRFGYVTEIHEINIWSEPTLELPLGDGTVRSYLEQNPIGKVGSINGKFMIQLNDREQEQLRRVFDAAKICLAGFDGSPPIDNEKSHRGRPVSH
jgi:hypothetical protein